MRKAGGNPGQADDRLLSPGVHAPGDWSRMVQQSDVPGHKNPGQASGDRLHIPGLTGNPEVTEPETSGLEVYY